MNFDFAISRVATFVRPEFSKLISPDIYTLSGTALYDKFLQQAQFIANSKHFKDANEAARRIARDFDEQSDRNTSMKWSAPDTDYIKPLVVLNLAEEFAAASAEVSDSDTLVAGMPSERIMLKVGGVDWIFCMRAHVTSCALEGNKRPTKLWWTYEAIPATDDPDRRPHDEDIGKLLTVASKIEDEIRGHLTEAFAASLYTLANTKIALVPARKSLNITITEGLDDGVDALLDELYSGDKTPSEILESNLELARDGLKTFEQFVHRLVGENANIANNSLSLAEGIPKVKGLIWNKTDMNGQIIAGLARRAGAGIGLRFMSDEDRRKEFTEQRIRMRSAARPWSALLANNEAINLERSLGLN